MLKDPVKLSSHDPEPDHNLQDEMDGIVKSSKTQATIPAKAHIALWHLWYIASNWEHSGR
jgi:hypothetical protein